MNSLAGVRRNPKEKMAKKNEPAIPEKEQPAESAPAAATQAPTPQSTPAVGEKKDHPFALFEPVRDRVEQLLGSNGFLREASFMAQLVNSSEQLQKSTVASRLQALVQLANTGLTLNPVSKLAYLVPRNTKIQRDGREAWETRCILEPSYMGYIKAATDSGSVKNVRAEVVYQGDDVDIVKGTTCTVVHVPYWKTGRPRGEAIAAYSVAVLHDGTVDVLDMGRDEFLKVKAKNESVKKGYRSDVYEEWEGEMWRKAVIRRHFKTLPKSDRSAALLHAFAIDEQDFGGTTAEVHRKSADATELRQLQLKVAEALDHYQGEDREEIREMIQAKQRAHEFTPEFARNMLAELGETKNP